MRRLISLLPLTSLAACGGGGGGNGNLETLSSTAITGPVSPAPTTTSTHSFEKPTVAKTYSAIGGAHSFDYSTKSSRGIYTDPVTGVKTPVTRPVDQGDLSQGDQLYVGNAGTMKNSAITVAYDPRSAVFTLTVGNGGSVNTTFQDPAHRIDSGGFYSPQFGVPSLDDTVRSVQAGTATGVPGEAGSTWDATTFFSQVPGSTTKYVTFAGYVRNNVSVSSETVDGAVFKNEKLHLERGAFAYGELTPGAAVPKSGSASYTGAMLATMVNNPTIDNAPGGQYPTVFQWIAGTSKVDVNFATNAVGVAFNGTVRAPQYDNYSTPQLAVTPAGSIFSATGSATIDLIGKGGFSGSITSAAISGSGVAAPTGTPTVNGSTQTLNIAGSSVDGGFYGPAAEEVGGGFRIVGGTPDQRVDILGTFTGAKPKP